MRSFIVEEKYNNKKLNVILQDQFNGLNFGTFCKAIRKKDIRVNNVRVNENILVHTGDTIKIYLNDDELYSNIKIEIIYEDENICIVNKPSGIEVTGENSLTENLKQYYNNINSTIYVEPCHRLDRNTSGLVLFAKNEEALNILLEKFKNHEIEKHYRATVVGIPKIKKADLTAYLFKDAKKSIVYISDTPKKGYEQIRTSYELISSNTKNNTSVLDVTLHTGKTHQIRAHLAHIGYPIVGDGKYGINEINKKLGYKVQQLTSYSLTFNFKNDSGILSYLNRKTINL